MSSNHLVSSTSEMLAIAVWRAGLMSHSIISSDDSNDGVDQQSFKTTTSSSSSNYGIPANSPECQVCGSHSGASWHYGAIVCEACKKFFIRSHADNRLSTYVCLTGTKSCKIAQSTRNCQMCRLAKCIKVGMSMRRDEQPESALLNIDTLIKNVKCVICSSKSSGIHFGVITCEACKVKKIVLSYI